MEKFTLELDYFTEENCSFEMAYYSEPKNPALLIKGANGERIAVASVNPPDKMPDGCIAVKNWSENSGMDTFLKKMGIIEETPLCQLTSGFVQIPVYLLTKEGKKLYNGVNK